MNKKDTVTIYVLLSSLGMLLLLILIFIPQAETKSKGNFDRIIVGGAFITSCFLGLSLALNPKWIKRASGKGYHSANDKVVHFNTRHRLGHHPDCRGFKDHVIHIKNKSLCAGCTGLAIGSTVGALLMGFYMAVPIRLTNIQLYFFALIGIFFITISFLEIVNNKRRSIIHVLTNILLVMGFLLLVVAVFEQTASVPFGVITLIISFLFLDTRIQLSSWKHSLTCKNCKGSCKEY